MSEVESGEFEWEYVVPFQKAISGKDGRRIIVGYASSEALDRDGEIVDQESLAKVAGDYMRVGGVVKFMHDKSPLWKGACGKVIDEYVADDGTVYKTSLGKKPFLVIEFTKSSAADHIWTMIDEGLYKGLSIGGGALKKVREVLKGTGKTAKRIIVSKWWETSIVDIPSNPDGLFTVIKSYGDAIEDSLITYIPDPRITNYVTILDDFVKGGPGSGIKGHYTAREEHIGRKSWRKANPFREMDPRHGKWIEDNKPREDLLGEADAAEKGAKEHHLARAEEMKAATTDKDIARLAVKNKQFSSQKDALASGKLKETKQHVIDVNMRSHDMLMEIASKNREAAKTRWSLAGSGK